MEELVRRAQSMQRAMERAQAIDRLVFPLVQAHNDGDQPEEARLTKEIEALGLRVVFQDNHVDIMYPEGV